MEKVASNVDLLYLIFKDLNLEEHLKLTNVCTQFRTVVIDFIWRNKYTKLEVIKIPQNYILTSNIENDLEMETEANFRNIMEDKALIKNKEFNNFMQLIGNNVKVLILSTITNFKSSHNGELKNKEFFKPKDFGVKLENTNNFLNLTSVTYKQIVVTDKNIKLLSKNCLKLEKLCLDDCFNSKEKTLVIGDDIQISTIQKMAGLKCLELKVVLYFNKELNYEMNEILRKLNKKQLIINVHNFSITNKENNVDDTGIYAGLKKYNNKDAIYSNTCEELSIGLFRSQRVFKKFISTNLVNFSNLKMLTMESWAVISISEVFFNKLTETCKQLTFLKLKYFEINSFLPLYTLNELILDNCSGLSWQDLKCILSNMTLKAFSLVDTEYIGAFEYFKITPTLESITVKNCQRCHLKKLFEVNNGENLKNLVSFVWFKNFAEVPIYLATNCQQLKKLITEPSSLLINNLYSLKSLEKLILKVNRKIKFSYIITILKHPSLKQFTLIKIEDPEDDDEYNDYLIDNDINDDDLLELVEIKTNLLFLNITLHSYFKIVQEFWFNLLRHNPKLTLMIRYNRFIHDSHLFLKYIVCHRKFPSRLKSIKICGYNIEISELRKNFEDVIKKIVSFSNQYKIKLENGYILL